MKGDFHVRFCENLRVQLPRVTRLWPIGLAPWKETTKPTTMVSPTDIELEAVFLAENFVMGKRNGKQ
jgi:hypothetical protein